MKVLRIGNDRNLDQEEKMVITIEHNGEQYSITPEHNGLRIHSHQYEGKKLCIYPACANEIVVC